MSGLKDQFGGVDPKSLIGQETEDGVLEETDEDLELEEGDSPDGEKAKDSEKAEDDDSKGRTIDNVYGELSRKQEKADENQRQFQENLMTQMGNLVREVTDKLGTQVAGSQAQRTLEDYSVAELTAFRDKLPAEDPQRAQMDSLIADKIVNEKVHQQVQAITGRDRVQAQRERTVEQAVERYPDLADENSSFYQKVDARIRKLDPNYVDENPRVVMDVANEVAIAEGVSPTRARQTLRVPGKLSASRREGAAPAPKEKEELSMTTEEATRIAHKLEGALGKKFTKEQIQEIRKNHQSYSDNSSMFTR